MANIKLEPPPQFDFSKPDEWPKWKRRFEQFRRASKLDEESQLRQVETLLYCMGEEAESVLLSTDCTDEERKSYETVISKFDKHFKIRQCSSNAILGKQAHVQTVYNEETGLVGQKRTLVAQVPTEGGGTAYMVAEKNAPPYTQRAYGALIIPIKWNRTRVQKKNEPHDYSASGTAVGCITCVVGLAIVSIAIAGLVSCSHLNDASVTGLLLGVVVLLMALVCCLRFINVIYSHSGSARCVHCSIVLILLLVFAGVLIPNTVFVAKNINFRYETNTTFCTDPWTFQTLTEFVMGLSYLLLLGFGSYCLHIFCFWLNHVTKNW